MSKRKETMASDRESIVETCTRLSWHIDQREWDHVAALLAEPILVDYTSVNGGEPRNYTPTELTDGLASLLGQLDATQHVQSGHLVTIEGASAVCTANVLGFHKLSNPLGSPMRSIGGTYRFELNRTAGVWKIHSWTFTVSWADGNHGIMAIAEAATEAAKTEN